MTKDDTRRQSAARAPVSVHKDQIVDIGAKLTLSAADEITLKTGSASIILKSNGDITIKGANLTLNGSGDITVKAAAT